MPLSVSTHRKEQEPQPTVAALWVPFPSKNQQSPNHTNSLNPSPPGFCLFNLGVALLVYSPFLAGMGTLINLLKKKLLTWVTFAHIVALIWIAYAGRLVFTEGTVFAFGNLKK